VTRRSRLSDTVWTAFTEAIRFVVVPIVLVNLVTTHYPQLTTAFMPDLKTYIVFFGGMIVAASTLEASYKPGTFKRLLFGLSALAFVCMWIFVIFGGGVAEFNYGPYFVQFDMSKIVYIILFGISLKGLLVISTYSSFKQAIVEEERKQRLERARERKLAMAAKAATRESTLSPSFSTMSKVAFEVTGDDGIGFSPAPPPKPTSGPTGPKPKYCMICGAKGESSDEVCRNCGAWFSKESFRFGSSEMR